MNVVQGDSCTAAHLVNVLVELCAEVKVVVLSPTKAPLPCHLIHPSSHTLLLNIQTIHWFRPPLILCVHLSHSASTVTRNWQELLGSFLF